MTQKAAEDAARFASKFDGIVYAVVKSPVGYALRKISELTDTSAVVAAYRLGFKFKLN